MRESNDSVTIRELYTLVDQKITVVNASISRLEAKFDALEGGRLSKLESRIANFEGKIYTASAIIAFLISLSIALAEIYFRK